MSLVVYVAAAVFASAALLLFPGPRMALRDPLTASTCVAVALGACSFACSAPATLSAVNEATGIPNFGAPMTYAVISAYSASLLVLLIYWRGGHPNQIRRMVTRIIATYGLLIAAIIVTFALADAPTERLRDLDTYYARTPYMREMIVLYLGGHAVCAVIMIVVCLKWARTVTGLLRWGLRLIIWGLVLDAIGFELAKIIAVVARWLGSDLDWLSTTVAPPMAALGAVICSTGFVVPRLLPAAHAHWRSIWVYRSLKPLWAEVQAVATAPKPAPSWWQLPKARLQWLELSIHDALLQLAPAFDKAVGQTAYDEATALGRSPREARVISEAAMVAAAASKAQHLGKSAAPADQDVTADRYRLQAVSDTKELVQLARALPHATVESRIHH
ncbi:MAB_1171c family putative transporter [Streptomyces sp. NPDC052415]|uniref:MAB_1171c family putative transporter n=1 Tax=Streptomyces sp. NPDC052415 TaxID=3365690 RepID=UPI0037CEE59C